jgi:ADP-ribose pyrophosphatase YjhB (NUDIX family)
MAAGRRRYPASPVVGVGALIFRGGKILLVERGKPPLKGMWSLPGGALETGETLEDGLLREVYEETGLKIKPVRLATVFERILRDPEGRTEYHYVLIDYVCRVTGGKATPASDVSSLAWAGPRDLRKYRLTEGTLPVIREAFRRRRQR